MHINLTTKIASALIAVCLTSASFAEVTHAKTVEFAYSPAELASDSGATRVARRIDRLARAVCLADSPIQPHSKVRECREDVADQLNSQIFDENPN